jgi:hypothetical protein
VQNATISVVVEVVCTGAVSCPSLPSSSDFNLQVLAGNPTDQFLGSSEGTLVTVETGAYEVIVQGVPGTPVGSTYFGASFSNDCIGSIKPNETKTCTVMGVYQAGTVSALNDIDRARRPLSAS